MHETVNVLDKVRLSGPTNITTDLREGAEGACAKAEIFARNTGPSAAGDRTSYQLNDALRSSKCRQNHAAWSPVIQNPAERCSPGAD